MYKITSLKLRYIFTSVLLTIALSAAAAPRTLQQARVIADSIARIHNLQLPKSGAARVKAKTEEVSSYYVFNNADENGFTIVSGEDQMPDVVGYTTSGTFDADNMPDALQEFLAQYDDMVAGLTAGDITSTAIASQAKVRLAAPTTAITPLITTTWNQNPPFNNQCPEYSSGQRSATGCVATAMAQILYYYGNKVSLHTEIPAYATSTYQLSVPAISPTTYDWNKMLTSYTKGSYTDDQAEAVAKLMYHCGAAVQMDYGPSSGAADPAACNALVNYFGMDQQLVGLAQRDNYSYAEWVSLLDNELESDRPVMYMGATPEREGHAFVCDGRDADGYYHINWGWGGDYDGYFDLTVLRPSGQGTGGSKTQNSSYAGKNSMIIGIIPDNGMVDSPLVEEKLAVSTYDDGSTITLPTLNISSGTRIASSGTFSGSVSTYLANMNSSDLSRQVSLGIKDSNGKIIKISTNMANVNLTGMEGNIYYLTQISLSFTYALPVGTNRIYVIESSDEGQTWTTCYGQDDYPFLVTVTETTLSTSSSNLYATIHALAPVSGKANTVIVKVHNDSAVEYQGAIYVMENTENTEPSGYYYSDNIYIPTGGTKTLAIPSYTNTADQKYYFVLNKDYQTLGTGTTGTLGDVNKSGRTDKSDIQNAIDIITGKLSASDNLDVDAVDMDGDGNVDITDVAKMVKVLNGK